MTFPQLPGDTGESSKVHFGLKGGMSVEVPIAYGFISRLRRRLFARWDERTALTITAVGVHASEDDDGYLDVELTVTNLGNSEIAVERVEFSMFYVGNAAMRLGEISLADNRPVVPWTSATIHIRGTFGAPTIRGLQQTLQAPNSRFSSPVAPVRAEGRVDLSKGGSRRSRSLSISSALAFVNLYNPSSKAAGDK